MMPSASFPSPSWLSQTVWPATAKHAPPSGVAPSAMSTLAISTEPVSGLFWKVAVACSPAVTVMLTGSAEATKPCRGLRLGHLVVTGREPVDLDRARNGVGGIAFAVVADGLIADREARAAERVP